MPTTAWLCAALAVVALGCGDDAPEPGSEPRPSEPEHVADEAPEREPWYTIVLPETAVIARHDQEDVIDLVCLVPPVTLTVLVPIPGQRDLDAWSATVRTLFAGEPALSEERGAVGSEPAIVQQTSESLRWVFVADGFGVIVKCFAGEPQDRVWLHEHCDPLVSEMTLVHPIHD